MGMDVYGKKPTGPDGAYFRANIWSWRPIHVLCERVLGRELPQWAFNEGAGFKSQKRCNELADALQAYLDRFPREKIALESPIRVDPRDGRFLKPGTLEGDSAYSTDREHVQEFIRFLRSCGGFEIW